MSKVIIEKFSEEKLKKLGINSWPIWTKEVSRFDWTYKGDEECLILDGEFTVETDEGRFNIKPGDFITFKDGLKCTWDITVPVKKQHNFK